jgi:hypothetical protein
MQHAHTRPVLGLCPRIRSCSMRCVHTYAVDMGPCQSAARRCAGAKDSWPIPGMLCWLEFRCLRMSLSMSQERALFLKCNVCSVHVCGLC